MLSIQSGVLMSGVRCGIATLVSCALIATPLAAQTTASTEQANERTSTTTLGSAIIVSPENLVRNPQEHYGNVVIVQAEIDRVLNSRVFLLDEDAAFAGPDILVVVPSGTRTVTAGAEVRVTGTVRPYVEAEMERDFDWFHLGSDLEAELEGRPVIVASLVERAGDGEIAGAIVTVPVNRSPQQQPLRVTAGELAASPEQYIGKRVTIRAEVDEVHNRQLFTLDEDRMFVGPDVIVYAKDGRAIVNDGEIVTVSGMVRKFIETDLFGTATWFDPWFNDLDATGRGLVRSRPVIVVDAITSVAGAQLYRAEPSRNVRGEER